MTRANSEQSPGFKQGGSSDDEVDDKGAHMDVEFGTPQACTPRAKLSLETQHRIARLIVKLASRSQYAKVRISGGKEPCQVKPAPAFWL